MTDDTEAVIWKNKERNLLNILKLKVFYFYIRINNFIERVPTYHIIDIVKIIYLN
jgi:hypothetical protein